MDGKKSDPSPKKRKTKAEEADSESEGSKEDVTEEGKFLEHSEIKTLVDLLRHLEVPRKKALNDHRYFLWLMEHALSFWYTHPKKYIQPEVCKA